MAVLRVLMARPGELVTADEILNGAWSGRVVTRDSVSTAIYELRQLLGDDAGNPRYIRTEARRGYRLIAPVKRQAGQGRARYFVAVASIAGLLGLSAALFDARFPLGAGEELLHVTPLRNKTDDAALIPLAEAIDATLHSALVQRNPGRIASGTPEGRNGLALETHLVACDLGPALVVNLRDGERNNYRWSRTYSVTDTAADASLVQMIARDVSAVL